MISSLLVPQVFTFAIRSCSMPSFSFIVISVSGVCMVESHYKFLCFIAAFTAAFTVYII